MITVVGDAVVGVRVNAEKPSASVPTGFNSLRGGREEESESSEDDRVLDLEKR